LRLQSELELSAVWQTPRNGGSGAGIISEMPTFEVPHPNLPGPDRELVISFAVLEEPNLNLTPSVGTGLCAEQISEILLDNFHGYIIEGVGSLSAAKDAIKPANEFPDCVAYRVTFKTRAARKQTDRVQLPAIQEVSGLVTLANNTEGATIYYTLDGGFPGPSNPKASLYSAPFDTSAVACIRWSAYKSGLNSSNVGQTLNPNVPLNS